MNDKVFLEILLETKANAIRHHTHEEAADAVAKIKQAIKAHRFEIADRDKNRDFMHNEHFPDVVINEVNLSLDEKRENYDGILDNFFSSHPHTHHCIAFNSKAHIVGEYLLRSNRRNIQIMGYDMVPKNVECVRQGSISFLIAQHGYMQGYSCIETLFNAIVLKKEVDPVNYMPIELLTKENIDFYRRKNIG